MKRKYSENYNDLEDKDLLDYDYLAKMRKVYVNKASVSRQIVKNYN